MFQTLKINTALLIIGAFIFKIFLLNLVTFSNSAGTNTVNKHATLLKKRRSKLDAEVSSSSTAQAVLANFQDATEEEDDAIKLKIPFFLPAFFSLFKAILNSSGSNILFDFTSYNLHSKKSPALSVLRI